MEWKLQGRLSKWYIREHPEDDIEVKA